MHEMESAAREAEEPVGKSAKMMAVRNSTNMLHLRNYQNLFKVSIGLNWKFMVTVEDIMQRSSLHLVLAQCLLFNGWQNSSTFLCQ